MIDRVPFSIEDEAKSLAASNAEASPEITEIWWFPDNEEIRLIEVDSTLPGSDEISPYCFPPDPIGGVHYRIAIALVKPEEKALPVPEGWVGWDEAQRVFEREAA